jgi:hypothetical protein
MTKYLTTAEVAKLIRPALAEKFPSIKFAVHSKVYSGGSSITVKWTDGPTEQQVDQVIKQFEGAEFDPMRDLKTGLPAEMYKGELVKFGVDYVFSVRHLSVSLMERAAKMYAAKFGGQSLTVKVWPTGGAEFETIGQDWRTQQEVNRFSRTLEG